jgi:hypothetical protein
MNAAPVYARGVSPVPVSRLPEVDPCTDGSSTGQGVTRFKFVFDTKFPQTPLHRTDPRG